MQSCSLDAAPRWKTLPWPAAKSKQVGRLSRQSEDIDRSFPEGGHPGIAAHCSRDLVVIDFSDADKKEVPQEDDS
jgi:hypothetical protein